MTTLLNGEDLHSLSSVSQLCRIACVPCTSTSDSGTARYLQPSKFHRRVNHRSPGSFKTRSISMPIQVLECREQR